MSVPRWCLAVTLAVTLACAVGTAAPAHAQKLSKNAVFVGRILADSTELPLSGAEIAVPSLSISVRADSLGRFRLPGITPGQQMVTVSQIGFKPLRSIIAFAGSDSVDAEILLSPLAPGGAQSLGKVTVSADRPVRGLADFDRRRQAGSGDFMTEETIRKASRTGQFADVLRRVPGVVMSRPPGGFGVYASAGRGTTRNRTCYVAVMIDRTWVYEGRRGELPFDLSSLNPDIVIAVEYYRGTSYIPAEFSKERNTCGVLVVWTKQG